jgi:hypothetical protein
MGTAKQGADDEVDDEAETLPHGISERELEEALALPATPLPEVLPRTPAPMAAAGPQASRTEAATPKPVPPASERWGRPMPAAEGSAALALDLATPPPRQPQTPTSRPAVFAVRTPRSNPSLAAVAPSSPAIPAVPHRPPERPRPWRLIAAAFFAVLLASSAVIHLAFVPLNVLAVWRRPARLQVTSAPAGAQVRIDGEMLSEPTPTEVEVRRDRLDHVLELSRPGFRSVKEVVRYDRSVALSHAVELPPAPAPVAPADAPAAGGPGAVAGAGASAAAPAQAPGPSGQPSNVPHPASLPPGSQPAPSGTSAPVSTSRPAVKKKGSGSYRKSGSKASRRKAARARAKASAKAGSAKSKARGARR